MAKLAFLGTGLMGAALAEAAAKRGDQVTVWNRTPAKAQALTAFGISVAATPAQAVAQAERVHSVLSDDAVVDAVYADCGDTLKHAVVVDHSTTSPAGTAARAARLEQGGIAFLHAPVFMSPGMCRAGAGMMLVAGPKAVFERIQGALSRMTGTVEYLGERRDLAAANKLFGNAMLLAITAGLADVYAIAKQLGISAVDAHALFGKFNPAGVIAYRGAAMAKGDYQAQFELSMARKDLRLMLESAGDAPLGVLPAIATRIDALLERGYATDDMGILAVDAVPKP